MSETKTLEQKIRELAQMLRKKAKDHKDLMQMTTSEVDQALFLGIASAQSQVARDLENILKD